MVAWHGAASRLRFPERTCAAAVQIGLALVLMTPLVIATETAYPYVVGKALYSRGLIAAVFPLWAALVLARPAWRPPRSVLLALLGAGAVVALVAAAFGVSPQRSLWSYYERMQGLFDLAHWIAFAVMAASVLRSAADWRRMLAVNVAVGLIAALLAIVRWHAPALLDQAPLPAGTQVAGTLGNAAFLGGYLQAIALLAGALLARSFVRPWPAAARPARHPDAARAGSPGREHGAPRQWRWLARAFWATSLAAALWGMALAASMGAVLGLVAGGAFAAVLFAVTAPERRTRLIGLATAGALVAVPVALAGVMFWRMATQESAREQVFDLVLLERITSPDRLGTSLGSRLDNWRAGVRATAARPVLGWGPDNYIAASGAHLAANSGRHLASMGAANESRDHAHNMLLEEAATKGLVGLAAYLALWGWTLVVAVRLARRARVPERLLVAGVAGALVGWFVQSQTLFYFTAAWLQHMLLLAFLVRHEAILYGAAEQTGVAPAVGPAISRTPAVRVIAGVAAAVLAAGSLSASFAMHSGVAALYRAETHKASFMLELEASIRAFEPMATYVRILLFENVAPNWVLLRTHYADEAFRLLTWCDRAARKSLAAEPHNWQIHHALAHLYREVAKTEPEYATLAERYAASSRVVAPNLDPMLPLWHGQR